jgi:Recombination endonuclease VII
LDDEKFSIRRPGVRYRKCKSCRWAVAKKRYEENAAAAERYKKYQKKWYKDNRSRILGDRKGRREKADTGKWDYLWNVYRLRKETYLDVLESQDGCCAICSKNKKLYVDHDHSCCPGAKSCGQCVRGLICQKCNMFMHYVDEYDFLDRARVYSKSRVANPHRREK